MTARSWRRRLAPGLLALGLAAGTPAPAAAAPGHVEPEVEEAPAAGRSTFSFEVEHGCGASPTTGVAIEVPDGSFDLVARPPAGWDAQVADDGTVVTFEGGPLDAEVPETFSIELVTPNLPGETVLFPTVQTCVEGQIAWIDPDPEAAEPAPRILLTENPDPILPTSTTTVEPSTTEAPPTSGTTAPDEVASPGADEGDGEEDDDGSGALVASLAAALLAAGLVAYVAYRRRS